MAHLRWRQYEGVAFDEIDAAAMQFDHICHGHGRAGLIGREGRLASPAPGRHDDEACNANSQRNEASFEELQ